jgi:alkanesulfonate monooxygenase SsuD/methylene tetrahydromethanopterin reductase-like flavin-dependent oxidoreductase (luciferase family)
MNSTDVPEPPAFQLVLGLDTFGDRTHDRDDRPESHAQTIRNVVEQGVLADEVGVDFFGIGEHHTEDFPMPAADVALGAIAARTTRIRLGSAVTVLSSDDPVRVFQRYSTLDAVSGGRAEVILGRGSSIESFPLFGYDLADYERLFEEKTNLFAELLKGGPVTWQGTTRAALHDQDVVPHTEFGPLPTWLGVGGSPESVIRAARYGFSLMLAIIGGPPARFAPSLACFARPSRRSGSRRDLWGCTRRVTSPRPMSRPSRSSGRAGWKPFEVSAENVDSGCRRGSLSWLTWDPRERSTLGLQRRWRRRSSRNSARLKRTASI